MFDGAQLGAGRADEVLAAAPAQRREVRFTDDPAVKHAHPARLAVLALDHSHHGLERGHIRTVAVEDFMTERKAVDIDDEREYDLLAVAPVIPAVAPLQERILYGADAPSCYGS